MKEFNTADLKDVKGNLLKDRNPVRTKAITIRITKKKGKRVVLKVNIKICVEILTPQTTTAPTNKGERSQ